MLFSQKLSFSGRLLFLAPLSLVVATTLLASGCSGRNGVDSQKPYSKVACADLAPGQSQTITGDTGTNLLSRYLLRRLPDSIDANGRQLAHYEAVINYRFVEKSGAPYTGDLLQHVERCFALANPKLTGPNGETLSLMLAHGTEQKERTPVVTVWVDPSQPGRGTSIEWKGAMAEECQTIIHETLHHLGLPDEYREMEYGWNCRVLGPETSIMADQYKAFLSAEVGKLVMDHQCLCPNTLSESSLKDCVDASIAIKNSTQAHRSPRCPSQAEEFLAPSWRADTFPAELTRVDPRGTLVHLEDIEVTTPSLPQKRASLLFPAEFRSIIKPGCEAENVVFNNCSQLAYKTSSNGDSCPAPASQVCSNPLAWVL